MSLVITLPPNGITAVCLITLSKNIATSVVPPPISTRATPSLNSSSSNVANADAKGSSINSLVLNPAFSTQRIIFLTAPT